MRATHVRTALIVVLSAALVVAGIVIIRQSAGLANLETRHAQDARTMEQLRTALRQQQPPNAMPSAPAVSGVTARARGGQSEGADTADLVSRDANIERLNEELRDAHDQVTRLQSQLQGSDQDKQAALTAANADFQKREQDWQKRLDALQHELDGARQEAQIAKERAASMEADEAKVQSENGAGSARVLAMRKTAASLEDLNRRRDAYLNSIVRRYRDVTDQFRAMAGELDSSRGPGASSFNGVALSRIQNAISLAEDDLRRVSELNAQSRQLESKLAKN